VIHINRNNRSKKRWKFPAINLAALITATGALLQSRFPQSLRTACGMIYPIQQKPLYWVFVGTAQGIAKLIEVLIKR
jgi:hypothetical protein